MTTLTKSYFVKCLIRILPEIERIVIRHTDDDDDSYISLHEVIVDMTKWLIELMQKEGPDSSRVNKTIKLFELGIEKGDDDVQNAIGLSFIENLRRRRHGEYDDQIIQLFGPKLAKEYEIQEKHDIAEKGAICIFDCNICPDYLSESDTLATTTQLSAGSSARTASRRKWRIPACSTASHTSATTR